MPETLVAAVAAFIVGSTYYSLVRGGDWLAKLLVVGAIVSVWP